MPAKASQEQASADWTQAMDKGIGAWRRLKTNWPKRSRADPKVKEERHFDIRNEVGHVATGPTDVGRTSGDNWYYRFYTRDPQRRGKGPVHVLRASERITTHPIKQTTQIAFKLQTKEIEFKSFTFPTERYSGPGGFVGDFYQMKELATISEISSQALKGMLFDLFDKSSTAVLKLERAENHQTAHRSAS